MAALTMRIGGDCGLPRPLNCLVCERAFVAKLEIGVFANDERLGVLCRQCVGPTRSRQLDEMWDEALRKGDK